MTRTQHDDIEQNEVLWIRPQTCFLPELPDGFALRVEEFLGLTYDDATPRRVWVRGPVLLDAHRAMVRTLTLCVPVDQPRAVLVDRAAAERTPPQPVLGGPITHGGRRYRRVY